MPLALSLLGHLRAFIHTALNYGNEPLNRARNKFILFSPKKLVLVVPIKSWNIIHLAVCLLLSLVFRMPFDIEFCPASNENPQYTFL